jgi:hypothetical protein
MRGEIKITTQDRCNSILPAEEPQFQTWLWSFIGLLGKGRLLYTV